MYSTSVRPLSESERHAHEQGLRAMDGAARRERTFAAVTLGFGSLMFAAVAALDWEQRLWRWFCAAAAIVFAAMSVAAIFFFDQRRAAERLNPAYSRKRALLEDGMVRVER